MAAGQFTGTNGWEWGVTVRRIWQQWQETDRRIVAAICYRLPPKGEIEFLLVRTRGGRWTFPKGGMETDGSAAAAATREAYEEAGVLGRTEPHPFTGYMHCKNSRKVQAVSAHLCQVMRLDKPLESYRCPTWFPVEKAKQRLREQRHGVYARELERVIDGAVRRLSSPSYAPLARLLPLATPAE